MSRVTCHVSRVTCHMLHVTCNIFFIFIFIFFLQSGEAYRWRVCYQRGLPRLVYFIPGSLSWVNLTISCFDLFLDTDSLLTCWHLIIPSLLSSPKNVIHIFLHQHLLYCLMKLTQLMIPWMIDPGTVPIGVSFSGCGVLGDQEHKVVGFPCNNVRILG